MFALLCGRIVIRIPISCPIIGNIIGQFKSKYSSVSQIYENQITDAPSSARAKVAIIPLTVLLKSYGFTDSQIAKFCTKFPIKPSYSPSNVIKPKLEFFLDIGFSHTQLAKFISSNLSLMRYSFEKRIKPNSLLLKEFNPCSTSFCSAVHLVLGTNPAKWKIKVSLYRNLGWSEEDAASAFFKYPWCMAASEKKIKQIMDFFVNERQCEPSYLAFNPVLISLSLEKRIKPRCLVIDILVKKQLVKKSHAFQYLLSGNKDFLEKYVVPYKDLAPEIVHAFNDKS